MSTLHRGQEWEGVVLNHKEMQLYESNKEALIPRFFGKVNVVNGSENSDQDNSVQTKIEELRETIEPFTVRQGKCF